MATQLLEKPKLHNPYSEYEDWFCLKHDSYHCRVCGIHVSFIHDNETGKIVVWEEKDHPILLRLAAAAQRYGMNPSIVAYEQNFGPCIPFDECDD